MVTERYKTKPNETNRRKISIDFWEYGRVRVAGDSTDLTKSLYVIINEKPIPTISSYTVE